MKRDSNVIEKRNYSTYLAVLAWNVVYGLFREASTSLFLGEYICEVETFGDPIHQINHLNVLGK